MKLLMVFLGGGLGSLLRYSLAVIIPGTSFPWATVAANFLASMAVGLLAGWLINSEHIYWRLLLITGFCGGFSTFSAFSLENHMLLQQQAYITFLLNIFLQVGGCIAAVTFGLFLARQFTAA